MKKKSKIAAKKDAVRKAQVRCRTCNRETNHLVVEAAELHDSDEEHGVDWWTTHEILQCQGCDTFAFRTVRKCSEDIDFETGTLEERIEIYPNVGGARLLLSDVYLLPNQLAQIYRETVTALNSNQPILCGIGVRSVIETVVKDRSAKGKDLSAQINDLVAEGVLTKDGAEILHKLRILGNRAAHEVKAHSAQELALSMDVVEHLLQAVYILPARAKETFK